MKKKKTNIKVRLHLRISPKIKKHIEKLAKRNNVSVNKFAEGVLNEAA
jgi:predicted HicB family RNase H-like nuclease